MPKGLSKLLRSNIRKLITCFFVLSKSGYADPRAQNFISKNGYYVAFGGAKFWTLIRRGTQPVLPRAPKQALSACSRNLFTPRLFHFVIGGWRYGISTGVLSLPPPGPLIMGFY